MKRLAFGLALLSPFGCSLGDDGDTAGDQADNAADSFEGDEGGECKDGLDNDEDGLTDCDDSSGCADAAVCQDTGGGDTDTGGGGDTDTSTDSDSGSACSGTAPIVRDAYAIQFGLYEFSTGTAPALGIYADVADPDGDLHEITLSIRWDTSVDGSVSASADGVEIGPYATLGGDECEATWVTVGKLLEVGADLSTSTRYEFAVEVTDANGSQSDEAIVSATTPDSSGNL